MFDEQDQSIGAVLVVDDVTEIRRLESMRSDFAANVSHELRTPITSIQGYAETLEEVGAEDQAQFGKFISIIRRNADRLGVIIEDLLTLASLERPGPLDENDLELTPLSTICLEVRERMSRLAGERDIELNFEGVDQIEVLTRGDLLVEAISNLVSNAIRYGPPGVPVFIRACLVESETQHTPNLRIDVEDQGPGIADRHVPRLFERFYRVDKARSRSDGGTGLGLAIVKHIALVHGGEIAVDTKVGGGSRFSLTIPRARPVPGE
jgi:two-component system phosphate regulon sensor histidine kinase PhoR